MQTLAFSQFILYHLLFIIFWLLYRLKRISNAFYFNLGSRPKKPYGIETLLSVEFFNKTIHDVHFQIWRDITTILIRLSGLQI